MDDYKHTNPLVLQSAELTERTPFCPEDQEIAGYFDGTLREPAHQKLERHLAECRFCLARVGMLNRQQDSTIDARVPEDALAAAKAMVKSTPRKRPGRMPAWVAAAVVLLGVFFVISRPPSTEPEVRQLRSIERPANGLEVLMPGPGEVLAPGSVIRWTKLQGGSHYTVYILSDSGDLLWTERLQGNEWILQKRLDLNPNSDFFFRVESELPGGGTLTSRHLAFRVADRQ
jgi:hypothetical protein